MGFLVAGQQAPQQSILGGFRLAAARLGGYYPHVVITINGTTRTTSCRIDSLSITEYEGGTPNEARLRVSGFVPSYGHEIKIGIQTITPSTALVFAGHIIGIDQITEAGDAANVAYDLTCLDYTWFLNRRKVSKQYLSQSATAILQDLIDTFTSGFTYVNVEAGLTTIDEITFTNEDVSDAIDRVMKRIGGYWKMDYGKDLHAFLTAGESAGSVTDASPRTAEIDSFAITRDLSQVRTRYFGEGMGSQVLAKCAAGETILPIEESVAFNAAGGIAKLGHQLITYTGTVASGTGCTVAGLPQSPSALTAAQTADVYGKVDLGARTYKVSFIVSGEESDVSSASGTVTITAMSAPGACTSAVVANEYGRLTVGSAYFYKVAFVNANGETLPGTASTTLTITAVSAPGALTAAVASGVSGNLSIGTVYYKVSLMNAYGETLVGTASSAVTITVVTPPSQTATSLAATTGGSMTPSQTYSYYITYVDVDGETEFGGSYKQVTLGGSDNAVNLTTIPTSADGRVTSRRIYRTAGGEAPSSSYLKLIGSIPDNATTTFSDTMGDDSRGVSVPLLNTTGSGQGSLTNIPTSADGRVTARRIYRTKAGGSIYYAVTTINDNATTTYTDNKADGSLSDTVPDADTISGGQVSLSVIPTGPAGTTKRRIYRTLAGGSEYKFLKALADNVTTVYTDNTPDTSLGEPALTVSTADGGQVSLSAIPTGPTGTTARKLYRTIAGGTVYKYLDTVEGNVTTTYADNNADSSLGAEAPTASGISTPAAATTLRVDDLSLFSASGGWVLSSNQVIRYTGRSGASGEGTLTGIPASGTGAVVAAIKAGAEALVSPQLTGVPASGAGAIVTTVNTGDEINLVVQRDDAGRQATLAALTGGDGIVEDWIHDRRLSEDEMTARCDAALELNGDPVVTVAWTTRDPSVKAARKVTFSLAAPTSLSESALKIQRVTIDRFGVNTTIWPWRRAEASSTRYSFEDLVRQIKGR
jgi:hypothetical protein